MMFSMKTCYGNSLKTVHLGASNEYPQHIFIGEIKKYQQFLQGCGIIKFYYLSTDK